jgi:hypothetical protein
VESSGISSEEHCDCLDFGGQAEEVASDLSGFVVVNDGAKALFVNGVVVCGISWSGTEHRSIR